MTSNKENFELKMVSLNVRGLNESKKRRNIFRWLHRNDWDIMMMQETYSNANIEQVWQNEWGGQILFSHGSNHSKGVMTLLRNNIKADIIKYKVDYKGRFILLKITPHCTVMTFHFIGTVPVIDIKIVFPTNYSIIIACRE